MARVLLVANQLRADGNASAWLAHQILQTLSTTPHETLLITKEQEHLPQWPRVQVAQAFGPIRQPWRLLKLIPMLMNFRPELIHWVEPADSRWALAVQMNLLPALAEGIAGQAPRVLSILGHWPEEMYRRQAAFFHQVWVHHPKLFPSLPNRFERAPLPTASGLAPTESAHPFVYVAGRPQDHLDLKVTRAWALRHLQNNPGHRLILGGGWHELRPSLRHEFLREFLQTETAARLDLPLNYQAQRQFQWAVEAEDIITDLCSTTCPDLALAQSARHPQEAQDDWANALSRRYSGYLN